MSFGIIALLDDDAVSNLSNTINNLNIKIKKWIRKMKKIK